jgi:hypothetical protein
MLSDPGFDSSSSRLYSLRPFTIVGQKSKGQKQFLTAVIDQNRFWPTISLLYFSRSGSKFCTIVELYCSLSFLTCSLDEVKNECVFDLLWTKVKNKMEKILVFDLYRDMVGQKHEVRNDRFWLFHSFLTHYSERPKSHYLPDR